MTLLAALWLTACEPDGPAADGLPVDTPSPADTPDAPASFALTSPAFTDVLPADYTCDGAGHSPPLAWTGTPAGTAELALLTTTLARDGEKWNWVLYHLPADTTALDVDTPLGVAGLTSDGPELAWAPPCSQGPGAKTYTFTLYALSAPPSLPDTAREVTGPVLTAAIADLTLGSAALSVSYTR